MIYVTNDELNKMLAKMGDNYEWACLISGELDPLSSNIGGEEKSYLGYKEQPIMLQCLSCKSHYLMKGCPNCSTTYGMELTYANTQDGAKHLVCGSHCGHRSAPEWECPQCGTSNVFSKFKPYVSTVFTIEKKWNPKCFIATAAYGSETATEVICLREFRDSVLVPSRVGNFFVSIYYLISPPLAKVIAISPFLKKATRELLLRPIVTLSKKWMNMN